MPDRPQLTSAAAWAEAAVARLADKRAGLLPDELALLRMQAAALAQTTTPAATDPTMPEVVRDGGRLTQIAQALAAAPVVALDLETSNLDPHTGEVVGIGLAADGALCYVPCNHRLPDTHQPLPDQVPFSLVVEALDLGRLPLVAHNAKFELKWLRHHGGITPTVLWDTMLAAKLLRSDLPADLKNVAARELDVPDWNLPAADLKRVQYLPVQRVARYCAKDVAYTLELMRRQQTCLS